MDITTTINATNTTFTIFVGDYMLWLNIGASLEVNSDMRLDSVQVYSTALIMPGETGHGIMV